MSARDVAERAITEFCASRAIDPSVWIAPILRRYAEKSGHTCKYLTSIASRLPGYPTAEVGRRILTDDQESCLIAALVVHAELKAAVTPQLLLALVEEVFGISVTLGFAQGFLKRHKDVLKLANPRSITDSRTAARIVPETERFCNTYSALLSNTSFPLIRLSTSMRRASPTPRVTL